MAEERGGFGGLVKSGREWLMRNKAPVASAGYGLAKATLPVLEELVEVAAHGTSASNKKRLFLLAMAVATGQIKNRNPLSTVLTPTPFYVAVEYDMMGKSVTVTLSYNYSGISDQASLALVNLAIDPIFDSVSEDLLAGDLTDFPLRKNAGLPDKKGTLIGAGLTPGNNPNSNQAKSNPPPPGATNNAGQPVGDRQDAWGPYTANLVYAALASPCAPIVPANVGGLAPENMVGGPGGGQTMTGIIGQIMEGLS